MSETPENTSGGIGAPAQKALDTLTAEEHANMPLTEDDKLWGMFGHLAALSSLVGVPFGSIVGPLVVYAVKKDQSRFVHFHALQSMFFHIGFAIASVVLAIPLTILALLTGGLLIIPLIAVGILLGVLMIVYVVIMGIKAKEGKWVLYPIAGKMAYDKVMNAPEVAKPAPTTVPAGTPPPSNPA